MSCARIFVRVCAVVLLALTTGIADAQEEATIYLVRPDAEDAPGTQLANLMRGELAADWMDVKMLDDERPGSNPRALLASLGARHTDAVTVLLRIQAGSQGIDVWLVNAATGYRANRQVETAEGARAEPAMLARRVADAVRALLWEALLESQHSLRAKPLPESPRSAAGLAPQGLRFALDFGMAAFGNFDHIGMAFDPLVRLRWQPIGWLQVRAGAAALGTGCSIDAPHGSANLTQSLWLVDALASLSHDGALRPQVSAGVGLYDVRVQGLATPPYLAGQTDLVALAVDAGLGVSWRGWARVELAAELHAVLSEPIPRVRVAGSNPVTLGLPALVATVTAASWL